MIEAEMIMRWGIHGTFELAHTIEVNYVSDCPKFPYVLVYANRIVSA